MTLLRASIPSTIAFETMIAKDVPPVLANANQIHQILMNLGVNAWHAMRERTGKLKVVLERFVVSAEYASTQPRLRPAEYVRISVSDMGVVASTRWCGYSIHFSRPRRATGPDWACRLCTASWTVTTARSQLKAS